MNSNAVTAVTIISLYIWFGTFAYIAPTIVAVAREVPNRWQIAVVNLLLGWTLAGWIAALVWALRPRPVPYPPPFQEYGPATYANSGPG